MLDRNALLRWLSALIVCTLALSWAACESTETGNPPAVPPVVTEAFLQRELVDEGLLVIGAPGAVLPGGSWIEITDVATGKTASVQTADDGGFRLLIADAKSTNIKYTAWNGTGDGRSGTMSPGAGSTDERDQPEAQPQPAQSSDGGSGNSADSAVTAQSVDASSGELSVTADAGSSQTQSDAGAATAIDSGSDAGDTTPIEDAAAAQGSDAGSAPNFVWPPGPNILSVTRDQ